MVPDYETTIVIPDLFAELPAPDVYAGYHVRIRWCNEIKKQPALKYGIGAQFLEKTEELTKVAALLRHCSECDLCDQRPKGGIICRINDSVCLCLPCYEHLGIIPPGPLRESVLRFIYRNVV